MTPDRASRRAVVWVAAPLFLASAAVTIVWCRSMAATDAMPMPGRWTMSMAWMWMPGQSWFGAAASFLGMWVAMMAAMMLPSLVPVLWRYSESLGRTGETRHGLATALVGVGYFLVWTVIGVVVFPVGAAMSTIAIRQPELARLVPIAVGVVVLVAGSLQLTAWKACQLACWREALPNGGAPSATAGAALSYGARLGLRCGVHGSGPMAILLAVGMMDLRAMAVVTAVLTAERLAPGGERVARATGLVAVATGLFLIVRVAAER